MQATAAVWESASGAPVAQHVVVAEREVRRVCQVLHQGIPPVRPAQAANRPVTERPVGARRAGHVAAHQHPRLLRHAARRAKVSRTLQTRQAHAHSAHRSCPQPHMQVAGRPACAPPNQPQPSGPWPVSTQAQHGGKLSIVATAGSFMRRPDLWAHDKRQACRAPDQAGHHQELRPAPSRGRAQLAVVVGARSCRVAVARARGQPLGLLVQLMRQHRRRRGRLGGRRRAAAAGPDPHEPLPHLSRTRKNAPGYVRMPKCCAY